MLIFEKGIKSGGGTSCAWGAYDCKIVDNEMMVN